MPVLRTRVGVLVLGLLAGALLPAILVTIAGAGPQEIMLPQQMRSSQATRRTPIVDVVERCRDAVVNISTARTVQMRSLGRDPFESFFDFGRPRVERRRVESVGSGFVIHESGILVTNAHVVNQASDIRVLFADQKEFEAQLVAIDPRHDLAVLRINVGRPLPAINIGRSDDLMIGETVVAIGNPVGLGHTVTSGIISALNRDLDFGGRLELGGLIQTDSAINPGNSGGPLLNINGELIGVTTAIRGDAQNIGFAIAVDRIWDLLPQMLDVEKRERVAVGMRVNGSTSEISEVRPNTPAARAGLRPRDRVVSVDNRPIRNGIDYYVSLLNRNPGDTIKLEVQRDGRTVQAKLPIEPLPPPDGASLARRLLGVHVLRVPDQLLQENGVPRGAKLMVEAVDRGSSADRLGILRGDFLLAINRTPVQTLEELGIALENVQSGETVMLNGLRWATDEPFNWTGQVRIP